jgi:hypothetical protein
VLARKWRDQSKGANSFLPAKCFWRIIVSRVKQFPLDGQPHGVGECDAPVTGTFRGCIRTEDAHMKRLRMAAFAALAGLAFVPGCCCFDGQFLNRIGLGPRNNCDCCECGSSCGGTPCCGMESSGMPFGIGSTGCCGTPCCNGGCSGQLVGGEGPMIGEPPTGFPVAPPGGIYEQGPQPRIAPQAQPMPAPASLIKSRN